MTSQKFETNPITYAGVVLALIAGFVVDFTMTELSWISYMFYGIGGLAMFMYLMSHRTLLVTDQAIAIKYLTGREEVVKKVEVVNYKRKKYYHKGVHVRWTFALESGKKMMVKVDYLKNEAGVTEAIDEFCSTLTKGPD